MDSNVQGDEHLIVRIHFKYNIRQWQNEQISYERYMPINFFQIWSVNVG